MTRRIVAILSAALFASASACGTKTDNAATASPTPHGGVVASASASVTSGMAPLSVAFSGVGAGGVGNLHYAWDFGDGADASEQNPTHVYGTDGVFTATFKATDSTGAFGTATVTITVGARNAPAVTASADHTSGLAPLSVHFTSTATGGSAPLTTSWNFGDGETAAEASPTHVFNTVGSYGAVVTVQDATGATASATVLIQVGGASNPVVAVSANPTSGAAPLLVTFTSQAAGGNGALTYAWDFGDGATATVASPTHTYTNNGSYSAKLTVKDTANNTATANVTIVVSNSTTSTMPDFQIAAMDVYNTGLNDTYEPNDSQLDAHYLGDFGTAGMTYTVTDGYLDSVDATYQVDVVNVGAATTTPFYVDFYQNQSIAPADGVYGDDYQQVQGLAANATTTLYFTMYDVAPGSTNSAWMKADSLSEIDEMDEANNVDGLDVQVFGDEDWFSVYEDQGFALKVDLSTLPADYDLELYDANGTMVASSENSGTTAESITYTTASTGMFYVRVLGYQGARDSATPYTLTVVVP